MSDRSGIDWVVCADDWGAHVSTTQHLASELAAQDRVLWINSIGMRAPSWTGRDFRRMIQKARSLGGRGVARPREVYAHEPAGILHPHILPWHLNPWANRISRLTFGPQIRSALHRLGMKRPHVLTINPMLVRHLCFERGRLVYLRLDDYAKLPGVDANMARVCEAEIQERADLLLHTAQALAPQKKEWASKAHYLPQGVDVEPFARVPLAPPGTRILGFFGLLAEWLDDRLVEETALRCPDWTLVFQGPVQYVSERLRRLPNVRILPPCPYRILPESIRDWSAAWIPFKVDELTVGVNPLKLREYLAAGLPTLCTPLPEAMPLRPLVDIVSTADEVRGALDRILASDSADLRRQRRASVAAESWTARAGRIREWVQQLG